jgi:hypothetical protein
VSALHVAAYAWSSAAHVHVTRQVTCVSAVHNSIDSTLRCTYTGHIHAIVNSSHHSGGCVCLLLRAAASGVCGVAWPMQR